MNPREIDLDGEVKSLTEEMQEWAEKQARVEFGSEAAKRIEYEGSEVERLRGGVAWASQEFGGDVTLRPLTDGARRAVRHLIDETAFEYDQCMVAVGTTDAPYVEHDPDALSPDNDDLRETLANIADLHPAYVDWASGKIQDLGSMGDDLGNSYQAMLLETRQAQTKQGQTGSDTAE